MNKTVIITARIENGAVNVVNNYGSSWRFEFKNEEPDVTLTTMLATIIAAQLTATINVQLLCTDAKTVKYRLEVLTGAEAR